MSALETCEFIESRNKIRDAATKPWCDWRKSVRNLPQQKKYPDGSGSETNGLQNYDIFMLTSNFGQ
jgi:ssDNA-binding Zn-finger/Zn-ribbon topoisomerase 1